jgi:hypothetical protein
VGSDRRTKRIVHCIILSDKLTGLRVLTAMVVVVVLTPPVTFESFAAVRFSHGHDKLVD